jgi:diacylglycerol kinase family enzyme
MFGFLFPYGFHSMRVVLIHNPGAGDDSRPDAKQLKAMIRDAGHDLEYCTTRGRKWKSALKEAPDLVAIAGGDGTVTKIARRVIGQRVPLAVLPTGTANNICKTLGIREVPVEELISGWASARRKRFDAGVVTGLWKPRHFIEGVGIGLFARAMPQADGNQTLENLNDAEVKATYAQQLLRDQLKGCPPTELSLMLDGKDFSGKYILIEAMNMQFIGPKLYLAPDALADDGLLDVVVVAEKHRRELDEYLATWQEGVMWPPDFTTLKGAHLEIEWTGFDLHIDDTLYPKKRKARAKAPARVSIDVEHDALEFLVPGSA